MSRPILRRSVFVGALIVASGALWLSAGPLNPPSGPVSAGGKTTQEIFDAVSANSAATGAIGNRGPAVPGANYAGGTIALATTPAISGPILGLRTNVSAPTPVFGGGGGAGRASVGSFTVVRETGVGSSGPFRAVTSGVPAATATITVPSSGGNLLFLLTNAYVIGHREFSIQRADGTFAAIEEIDLYPERIRITGTDGGTWQWNFAQNTGGQ